jgi:uncharacterized pyridoxamine 5'-phosphate oxidase family protein
MNEVVKFLEENPLQYLATIGLDGKPKVRPFQFMLEKNDKLYFCTSNQKEVYREIKANPDIELCACSPQNTWIRLAGTVVFSQDSSLKAVIIAANALVRSIFKTPDNPVFEIFYLKDVSAVITGLPGQPSRQYRL